MNWYHTYDVPGVARKTCDTSRVLVPRKSLIERDIWYKNSVTDDKLFWDRIPIHADTSLCYVTSSESSWSGNKYWKQTGKQIKFQKTESFFLTILLFLKRCRWVSSLQKIFQSVKNSTKEFNLTK